MSAPNQPTGALDTISSTGSVPATRFATANDVQEFVIRLTTNDIERSKKRAAVRGLIDGNPPYRHSALRAAGRAEACNVNWGTGRSTVESGVGAYYDLAHEAPGVVSIRTGHGKPEERDAWSRIMSAEAEAQFKDPTLDWDFEQQQSQNEMVLHGRGPFMFEDNDNPFPRSLHDGDLKVPERTPATVRRWEVCSIDVDYYPPEVYAFIRDEEAAVSRGWDIDYTQRVIANAMDIQQPSTRAWDREFFQDQYKQNSLNFVDESKIVPLAHVFWKEFSGKITHAIVQRDGMANAEPKYLFFHFERYNSFTECVHPMYFDRGNGGWHYTVTGLGVKMYGAMVYENRLLCNLMDKAFAPKIFFKFGSASSSEKFTLTTFGDWGKIPAGTDVVQNPIAGLMQDGLAMFRTSSELMRSNLSNYRQTARMDMPGNPATAKEVMLEASKESALNRTGINRYYQQLDVLYFEIVRRLCNPNSTHARAKAFQEACVKKGVPRECFGRIEAVNAVRVVGEGNPFLRREALEAMRPDVASLPEEGRNNWLNDRIAATAGAASVERYNPSKQAKKMADEQDWMLAQAISMMRQGMAPPITSEQNPVKFAAGILQAATQALQSLQQGGNPMQVLAFLQLAGPAVLAHLRRFAQDPMRKQIFKVLLAQLKKVSSFTDKLRQTVAKMQKQQQAQQQKTQAAMSDQALAAAKARSDIAIKQAKARVHLQTQLARTRQNMALADASTASTIRRQNRMQAFQN